MVYQVQTKENLFVYSIATDSDGNLKSVITPIWIRVYDNGGKTCDRYTIVFTGKYPGRNGCDYLSLSSEPTSPQGFCQHGWHFQMIDRPTYIHLGKPITFKDLPLDCQTIVLEDYRILWEVE